MFEHPWTPLSDAHVQHVVDCILIQEAYEEDARRQAAREKVERDGNREEG